MCVRLRLCAHMQVGRSVCRDGEICIKIVPRSCLVNSVRWIWELNSFSFSFCLFLFFVFFLWLNFVSFISFSGLFFSFFSLHFDSFRKVFIHIPLPNDQNMIERRKYWSKQTSRLFKHCTHLLWLLIVS